MNYVDFYDDISYTSKKNLICFMTIGFIISLLNRYDHIKDIIVLKSIIQITQLLTLIILFIFLNHIRNLKNEKIYNIVTFFIFIKTLIFIINLSYYNQFIHTKNILLYLNKFNYANMEFINLTIVYYLMAITMYKEEKKEELYKIFITLLIFLYIPSILSSKYGDFFYAISFIQLIYINSRSISFIKLHNVNKDKINLLKINIIVFLAYSISELVDIFITINYINTIIAFMANTTYISYVFYILKQIIKENYNFVFLETIEANRKLEDINNEIKDSNIRLEKAYEKVNNRKNLYKDYLAGYGQPIILLNENFRIQYCNNRFLKLFNEKDLKNIINRRIETYIDFDFSIYESIVMKERFIIGIDLFKIKYEVEFINLIEEDIGIMLAFKDLTEDLKIIEMKEELENIKEREIIKTNFLSNISHDIKTPINVIYSEIQLEKIFIENKDKNKLEEYNEISKKNCLNLTKLTNNIIDISKIDSENLEPNLESLNIVEFIEEYINNLSNYIKINGLEVIFDTEEEFIEINFDSEMIRRILINLISNSIKYSSSYGVITINILNEEDHIIIEFKDNGIGMSKEFLNKIFDKYSMERSEEGDSKGFGIGLYVVFNLVKAQNGEIEVSSTLGEGTNFKIKFYK